MNNLIPLIMRQLTEEVEEDILALMAAGIPASRIRVEPPRVVTEVTAYYAVIDITVLPE